MQSLAMFGYVMFEMPIDGKEKRQFSSKKNETKKDTTAIPHHDMILHTSPNGGTVLVTLAVKMMSFGGGCVPVARWGRVG